MSDESVKNIYHSQDHRSLLAESGGGGLVTRPQDQRAPGGEEWVGNEQRSGRLGTGERGIWGGGGRHWRGLKGNELNQAVS